jgi:site-specific DNA-methyltransferase (adenine-specific)
MTPRNTILEGDALDRLAGLTPASVDCVITSPPYYGLRDYGATGQLGLEPTVTDWVDNLRAVCRQVARVLTPTGSLWLNLGDAYSRHARYGAPPKGLLLAPERLLLALATDGWIVRNKIIWAKPNPMPTSVGDRLTATYDPIYLLVRSRRYFFDLGAIREPAATTTALPNELLTAPPGALRGKNPGDVWRITSASYPGAHFATFPPELVRRPLLAGCPEAVCTQCGRPWRRTDAVHRIGPHASLPRDRYVRHYPVRWRTLHGVGDLTPCGCGAPTRPGLVLDPFFGTGTVGAVARELGRDWLGIELSPAYIDLAENRLGRSEQAA